VSDETRKKKMPRLPRGIQRRPDGRLRLYTTDVNGKPHQPIVTWDLLKKLKVPTPEETKLPLPGVELAKKALAKLQSKIMEERRTGAIEASATVKIAALFPLIKRDYQHDGLKSWGHVQSRWDNHINPFFGHIVASELTTDHLNQYIDLRDDEGAGPATTNRELCILRRLYKLAQKENPPKVTHCPYFKMLAEPKARQGFLEDEIYDKLSRECLAEGLWLRGMLAVGCNFGWRKSEVLNLQVCQLDFPGRVIRLFAGETKNDEGRTVKMTNEVYQLLSACVAGKGPTDFVFTRDGDNSRIHDFRKAWSSTCERAGCPALMFHDLRRTAARNLRRLGVSETVIMKVGGWLTREIFTRYDIIDESDLEDAAQRLDGKRERERVERERLAAESATGTGVETGTKTGIVKDGAESRVQ
jgi:integrase